MGDINKYFSKAEFACHDRDNTPAPYIDGTLVAILTLVREHFDAPVTINSSYRTPEHNRAIGGVITSHHLYTGNGAAADIVIHGIAPKTVHDYINDIYPHSLGLGSYETFTHVDARVDKARWDG